MVSKAPIYLGAARLEFQLKVALSHLSALERYSELYAGFDVGRKHDLPVLALLEAAAEGFTARGFIEMRQAPFDEQMKLLTSVLGTRNIRRLCIDASGIGLQLSEQLKQRYGSMIEPVTFTLQVKEDLAARMLKIFQTGEMRIPDDPTLLADLHSVERQITAAGNVRYAAPRSEGSHADRFMALALALHAASGRSGTPFTRDDWRIAPRRWRCSQMAYGRRWQTEEGSRW